MTNLQPALECKHLSKSFGAVQALHDFSLQVKQGEILSLIGPSGCGKTTLLRLIAGFECSQEGEIHLQGNPLSGDGIFIPPEKRGVGMVFQDYALFPHLNIGANVAFGLDRLHKAQRAARSAELLTLVGLASYEKRLPHELSGGERQRVALARALAPAPVVLLLDEPFSNLDSDRRLQMRSEVRQILKQAGSTSIFVTHDQEEALFMGDRLAVLNKGRLEQVGTPEEVFQEPSSRFVAEFIGQTDFIHGSVTPEGISTEIGLLAQPVTLPRGSQVEVAVRADDVAFQVDPSGNAQVEERLYRGSTNLYALRLPSGRIVHSLQAHTNQVAPGTRVQVLAQPGHPLAYYTSQNRLAPEAPAQAS